MKIITIEHGTCMERELELSDYDYHRLMSSGLLWRRDGQCVTTCTQEQLECDLARRKKWSGE